jgi:hypothetical protein
MMIRSVEEPLYVVMDLHNLLLSASTGIPLLKVLLLFFLATLRNVLHGIWKMALYLR